MKIQVLAEDGSTAFSYDTSKSSECLCPGMDEKSSVVAALTEATSFLGSDQHVISSIKADILQAIGRIEHELGAHPAFTWAQTKLGNAAAHLEAYVAGNWEEPKQGLVPPGTGYDVRGVLVQLAPAAAAQS